MKKLFSLLLVVFLLVGCSSGNGYFNMTMTHDNAKEIVAELNDYEKNIKTVTCDENESIATVCVNANSKKDMDNYVIGTIANMISDDEINKENFALAAALVPEVVIKSNQGDYTLKLADITFDENNKPVLETSKIVYSK